MKQHSKHQSRKTHSLCYGVASMVAALVAFLSLPANAFAAEGSEIFQEAATAILTVVLPGSFGGCCAMVAGVLALVSAAAGSYRGTWALIFVCLACILAKDFVNILFPV